MGLHQPLHADDVRLRTALYQPDQVYALRGVAGFQIDLEFEHDERFVGLGSGDVEALSFESQDNHLFIKPKALSVHTNLTVLTTRRVYHFDYLVSAARGAVAAPPALYALRFEYSTPPVNAAAAAGQVTDAALAVSDALRNQNYWYCGDDTVRPLAAWDDGVHTHLRFNPRTDLPAVFVRNDDNSESLLNFSIEHDEMVIHRVARQFLVRRGRLTGCIVNKSFRGTGHTLDTGTVSTEVTRTTRNQGPPP
jgi:type IV secretion system protein VirB9